jgi:hypothetical protein
MNFGFLKRMSKIICACAIAAALSHCNEFQSDPKIESDIIVQNKTEFTVWIKVDGYARGPVKNDELLYTVWKRIAEGTHHIEAYYDPDYLNMYCWSDTMDLRWGEDFYWILLNNGRFDGNWQDICHDHY